MHFLKEPYARVLTKSWATVECELIARNTLRVPATVTRNGVESTNIFVAKNGTSWALLPDTVRVVDPDGEPMSPSKGRVFFVTIDTFNPWHGLLEMPMNDMY